MAVSKQPPPDTRLTVGVLGGMGPEATIDFMAKVVAFTPADCDQDHVPMLVDNKLPGAGPPAGDAQRRQCSRQRRIDRDG